MNLISVDLNSCIDCVVECLVIGNGILVDIDSIVVLVGVVEEYVVRMKGCIDGVVV